jgi:segregation and condensation protein B
MMEPGVEQEAAPPAVLEDEADGEHRRKLCALEAVLFMAADPLDTAELAEILEVSPREAGQLAEKLALRYADHGLQVSRIAGGYQVSTRPEYGSTVARLHKPERFRLSRAALETLAIVAYKQPVTRPEVDAIRGVNSDSPLNTLLEYELVSEAGRKDAPGRPVLYRTTDEFLGRFGLNSIDDLPRLDSIPAEVSEEEIAAEAPAVAADSEDTAPEPENPQEQ